MIGIAPVRVSPVGIGLGRDHPHRAVCRDHGSLGVFATCDDAEEEATRHERKQHCPCGEQRPERDRGSRFIGMCDACVDEALSDEETDRKLNEEKERGIPRWAFSGVS